MAGEDPAYAARVRGLDCAAGDLAGPACAGAIHAHHAGRRPGVSMKAHDHSCVALCAVHHGALHGASAPFRMTKRDLRAWQDRAIAATQAVLGCTPHTGTRSPQGAAHHGWKGDGALRTTKRERAQRRYRLGTCQGCAKKPATDRHHVDGNTGNNAPSNVRLLCRRCHMLEDGRLDALHAATRGRPKQPSRPCRICGRMTKPKVLNRGRCRRCAEYFRRNGTDRTWGDLHGARVRSQEAWSTPCMECGRPPSVLKTAPVRGLCRSCYDVRRRRGDFREPRDEAAETRRVRL